MFDKEAREYAEKKICQEYTDGCMGFYKCKEDCERYHNTQKYWKDGAEFVFNKMNEWNYPSEGKYPKENKRYLCKIKCFVGGGISYECFDYDTEYGSWKDACGDVIAWKELPKE